MRRLISRLLLAVFLLAVLSAGVLADTVVRSFDAQGNLQPGWVVALSKSSNTTVVLAPSNHPERIYGVVIDPNSAPLTVQKQNQQVFVANSGNYPVLVSTQAGNINTGDYLTLSATDGIATKASSNDKFIIGRALQGFSGGGNTIVYANDGAALGRIVIEVAPGKNPLLKEAAAIPDPLRRVSESVAGKTVSAVRIYAALIIFLVAIIISAILLSSGIRSSLIAIGRNPLSRHLIIKGMSQVIVAAALVLVIGLFGVYLLLKA
jgi:hypothetical protein